MQSFEFLLVIAIILLSTKALGLLSEKVHMPQVVGALLAGLILGPSFLGVLEESEFIQQTAEIGVILIMFLAGLDTDLVELKKNGVASVLIAAFGVILTSLGGTLVYWKFFGINSEEQLIKAIFMGIVLTATSVSITVETLREMGKLKGRMGTTILGAAIIDDILGIIISTIVTSMNSAEISPINVIFKIIQFFIFIAIIGVCIHFFKRFLSSEQPHRRVSIYSLVFCFLLAYISERFFGLADITGAYFAGILLCNLGFKGYVEKKINILSYMIFSPIFFASIGLKTSLNGITSQILTFALVLTIVAILAKIIGGFSAAKLSKFDNISALAIGFGMISRGEVELIVAQKGAQAGILDENLFPAIVLVVIVTTLLTPVFLKLLLSKFSHKDEESITTIKRADH